MHRGKTLVRAGLFCGVADGLFAAAMSIVLYGNVWRIFQGVASTLLGSTALSGGLRTAGLGLLMHFGVAFAWSFVFLCGLVTVGAIARAIRSVSGAVAVAAVYGPCVWLMMSLVVIPALTYRPRGFGTIWWIELVGHIPFVGIPIVFSCRGSR